MADDVVIETNLSVPEVVDRLRAKVGRGGWFALPSTPLCGKVGTDSCGVYKRPMNQWFLLRFRRVLKLKFLASDSGTILRGGFEFQPFSVVLSLLILGTFLVQMVEDLEAVAASNGAREGVGPALPILFLLVMFFGVGWVMRRSGESGAVELVKKIVEARHTDAVARAAMPANEGGTVIRPRHKSAREVDH